MTNPFEKFASLSDHAWVEKLIQSTKTPVIDGVEFPGFPDDVLQAIIVGSSNENALREAGNFYSFLKGHYAAISGRPLKDANILDFGIGWGRFTRMFARDVGEQVAAE